MTRKRIDIIDGLRGLVVILMIFYHGLNDVVLFLGVPERYFENPYADALQMFIAVTFITLSGVSSRFARNNVRRGIKVFLIAIIITAVTLVMDMPILFGVLHFLGFAMVFYGLTHKLWEAIPEWAAPIIYVAGIVLSVFVTRGAVTSKFLWMFGWTHPGFESWDYFPILPWIFVFLLGTWIGKFISEGRFPRWFYEAKIPILPAIGKRALIIYVLHQPILYGLSMAVLALMR